MHRPLALILAVALLAVGFLVAQNLAPAPPAAATRTQAAIGEEEAPVPVPEPSNQALSYYRSGNVLWFVDLLWGLLVPVLLLFTGISARIRTWAQKLGRTWFFVVGIYFVIFAILNFILTLPLSYYEDFIRQHAYGLSNQSLAKWWSDALKSLAVGILGGFLFLWVPYLLLKKSPRRWWLHISLLAIPFLIFVMLISPILIDPLFNDFGPMKDKALEAKILALAGRAGIEGGRVYEVNKSVDTSSVNAYVTGFFQTKRIVLWDTILAKLNDRELLVVMGHEMGHYVLNHIITGLIFSFFLILAALYLAYRAANGLIEKYKYRFGFESLSDIASLPLLVLLIGVFSFALSPLAMAFSRYQEHEADRFALEITRDNHAAATAFVKLQQENLSIPRPGVVYRVWRLSHPAVGERIDFCNEYHPWRSGQPMKYADRFK
jgi:STE24 endopeptidase